MKHWEHRDLADLSELAHWRLVPSAPWLELPGLRHQVVRQRALLVTTATGATLMFLRLPRALASLGRERFRPDSLPGRNGWVLSLQRDEDPGRGEPGLPAGPARLEKGEGDWPELWFGSVRLGSAVHPLARDWAWAWAPTCGPVIFRVRVQRSAAEIESWLLAREPQIWAPGPRGLLHSRVSDDSRVSIAPGCLSLMRSFLSPPPEQVALEHDLLMEVADGALGPLTFDLFDGDYYNFMASGESGESLASYLRAPASRRRPHRWNRFPDPITVDARQETLEQASQAISRAMGWGEVGFADLCQRFATACVPKLPRRIVILGLEQTFSADVQEQLGMAQPRVQFWFRFHQDPAPEP